jgi:hypothetical protein
LRVQRKNVKEVIERRTKHNALDDVVDVLSSMETMPIYAVTRDMAEALIANFSNPIGR